MKALSTVNLIATFLHLLCDEASVVGNLNVESTVAMDVALDINLNLKVEIDAVGVLVELLINLAS